MKTPSRILLACLLAFSACSKKEVPAVQPAASVAAAVPEPAPAEAPGLSEAQKALLVRPYSPVLGPAQAPVTIVEFLDPACEACRAFAPVVKQIMFLYPDRGARGGALRGFP